MRWVGQRRAAALILSPANFGNSGLVWATDDPVTARFTRRSDGRLGGLDERDSSFRLAKVIAVASEVTFVTNPHFVKFLSDGLTSIFADGYVSSDRSPKLTRSGP